MNPTYFDQTRDDPPINPADFTRDHQYRTFYCGHCGSELTVPLKCGNRFCSVCMHGPRARVRLRLQQLFGKVKVTGQKRLKLVTLTVPNQADAYDAFRLLVQSFRKLRGTAWWKKHVDGGVYVMEATFRNDLWHVHLHCIILALYMPQAELSDLWKTASGAIIVDVRQIRKGTDTIQYLTKYVTKTDVPLEQQGKLSYALKGSRLYSTFGSWHSIKLKVPRVECPCKKCGSNDWVWEGFLDANRHKNLWSTFG